jgi:prepilin peptidase CpaA
MLLDFILVIVLGICFITDLKYQKIYNKIIFPSLILAILLNTAFYSLNGFKLSMIGFAAGLSMLLVPYFLGGIGAGDVKLLAFIGAIKGSAFVINTTIYMALIGGVIALIIIISHKEFVVFMKELILWLASLLQGVSYKLELPTTPFLKKYPYGVAIVGGAAICLLFKGAWFI